MTEDDLDEAEIRRLLENLVFVLGAFRKHAPRISVAQIQATFITALDTMDTKQGKRLPTVGDYVERLDLSPSGASRLMSHLSSKSSEVKSSLVECDGGPGVRRSESFVLTEAGRDLVVQTIESISGRRAAKFDVHDFISFALARHGGVGAVNIKVKTLGPKTLLVGPRRIALSSEIREWCKEHHLTLPIMKAVAGGMEMEFSTEEEAFEFTLRWRS